MEKRDQKNTGMYGSTEVITFQARWWGVTHDISGTTFWCYRFM